MRVFKERTVKNYIPLFIIFVLPLITCAAPEKQLLGTWRGTLAGNAVQYTFTQNTLVVNNEITVGYSATKDALRIGQEEETRPFTIKGKVLTIDMGGFILRLVCFNPRARTERDPAS
jgi:hypothetical protein